LAIARTVLILGGGASGTMLAIQLLRSTNCKVVLIERSGSSGKGIAYGQADPIHLLNVRAANMSAYPDVPDHFVRWLDDLNGTPSENGGDNFKFATRLAFGNYLYDQLRELDEATGRFTQIHGEAVALKRSSGRMFATLDNFRRVIGDVAVIATGYETPSSLGETSNTVPWLRVDRASSGLQNVLLRGTGLSMVDQVQSLVAAGYDGKIYAISRRGLIPCAHRPIDAETIEARDVPIGQSLVHVFRWVRERAEAAQANGSDWRAVLDGLRPYVQQLWRHFSAADKSRFVRHARPWWDVRRHRMAPKVASAIADLIANGRLVIIAANIISSEPTRSGGGGIDVTYRRRGRKDAETLTVQGITDCTGFSIDIAETKNPLVRSLLNFSYARPDRLGLGFDVDATAALISAQGVPAHDLFAIGPLTRGAFWEITGIPDIREQCARLAERLASAPPKQGAGGLPLSR
jgi:uncharacterized NAD(P)/FAD-binding protein YdhS